MAQHLFIIEMPLNGTQVGLHCHKYFICICTYFCFI